jgi:hypothetical protein
MYKKIEKYILDVEKYKKYIQMHKFHLELEWRSTRNDAAQRHDGSQP